jgi:hypothetical protein
MISVEPITDESWEKLDRLARDQGHDLWAPTHVINRDGEIAGSVSIGGVPIVHPFFGKGIMSGRDCLNAASITRRIIMANGWNDFLVILGKESPMYKHASHFGLMELGENVIHYGKV